MQYANKVCKMDPKKDSELLKRLRQRLQHKSLPTQEKIADAIDIHQSTVSRASTGKLKRVTDTVKLLDDYVSDFVEGRRKTETKAKAARRSSAPKKEPDRRNDFNAKDVSLARSRCEEYLNQGYNARALINQIELLREVQSAR